MTILRAVLQKFSGKKIPGDLAIETDIQTPDLHGPHGRLWQLQASRQLLEVVPRGHKQSYQSMIIAIDEARGLLWLDELFPEQKFLQVGDEICVRHQRNGELLTFTTSVIAWGSSFGASGIAVILPEFADYQPRRATPRCDLSQHTTISAKIRLLGQEACYGTVKDISYEGLCVQVPGNLLGQLHRGGVIPLCEVHLNKELHIHCRAQVRSFRLCREPYRATQISLEFVDLQPKRRVQLQQFIHRLTLQDQTDSRAA